MNDNNKPEEIKLNWTVKEYIGCQIRKKDNDLPLTNLNDLSIGDEILLPTFTGYIEGTISHLNGKKGSAQDNGSIYSSVLEFDGDDRHCWVSVGLINTRAIRKI